MRRLEGSRAVVTGAASGIGRAIAQRFAAEGARVVVGDVDLAAAQSVARELGGECFAQRVDVTRATEVEALVGAAVTRWGGLDVMVNNAGVGVAATVCDTAESDWERVIAVNLSGTFYGVKYAVAAMRACGGGSIINTASIAGLVGVPDRAAYCASKGGVVALTRAAAIDHVHEGIRINCIAPGTVDTPWIGRITAGYADPAQARQTMEARQPHGRFVTPEEIAAMAAYLASSESASVVGAAMIVDGGLTAR
ncbi:glucose 1-dehydrogenase [bacterium]|nr:MAG: glucose 1-dehydrogenase [bacterium]